MEKNIIEKIWDSHVVETGYEDYPEILFIDLQLIHEVTSPQAFLELEKRKLKVFDSNRTLGTIDHNISTAIGRSKLIDSNSRKQIATIRKNCKHFGIRLLDLDSGKQGIVHVIGPEFGITQPGLTIVCGDSHTSTHGAFGALSFGIGTTEIAHVLATSCMLIQKPKTMKIAFCGERGKGITAKDLIMKLIQKIGIGGGTGHVIEYSGKPIEEFEMEERMTICNMSIECGSRAGLIAPDETTYEYLKNKVCAPKGAEWEKAINYWKTLKSDKNAKFDKKIMINIDGMAPMVTWGINPEMVMEINEKIPHPEKFDVVKKENMEKALAYVKLKPGEKIEGVKIDYVFIGSCTNARISDLRQAVKILKGKRVKKNVKVYVVPGSETVKKQAEEEGLKEIFEASGCLFRNPGCSMCIAMNEDKVPQRSRCISTSNRNFIGRQGSNSITHLVSPIMAAAAAITGEITDVRKFL